VSNVYLLFAEEVGLIGLGFFLLVMGVFFAYAWRAWRRMEGDSGLEPMVLGRAGAMPSPGEPARLNGVLR
jgi:O-antigen ligase